MPLRRHRPGIRHADSPVHFAAISASWVRKWFRFRSTGRDTEDLETGGRSDEYLVARHLLRQNGFSVLLPPVNLSFTKPEYMVVVCYRLHYCCWVGQHSGFLVDLPVFYH